MKKLTCFTLLAGIFLSGQAFASSCESEAYSRHASDVYSCKQIPNQHAQLRCTEYADKNLAKALENCAVNKVAICKNAAYSKFSSGISYCSAIPNDTGQKNCKNFYTTQLNNDLAQCELL